MSDILQYLQENANFQNQQDATKAQLQAYGEQKSMGLMELGATIPAIGHFVGKAKEIYQKGSEIFDKTNEAIEKTKVALSKTQTAVENSKSIISEGVDKVGGRLQEAQGLAQSTADTLKGKANEALSEGLETFNNTAGRGKTALSSLSESVAKQADPGSFLDSLKSTGRNVMNKGGDFIDETLAKISPGKGAKFINQRTGAISSALEEGDPEAIAGLNQMIPRGVTSRVTQEVSNIGNFGTQGMTELQDMGQTLGRSALSKASDIGSTLEKTGNDFMGNAESGIKSVSSTVSNAVEEGANVAKSAVSSATAIGSEALTTAGETVGAVASELLGPVGDLAMIGMGIYDVVHSMGSKPQVFAQATPTFSAGL